MDLTGGEVASGVDRFQGAFSVNANAREAFGGDVLFAVEILGEDTNDLDDVIGIQTLDDVDFLALGLLPVLP